MLIGDAARSRAPEATAAPPAVRGEHVVRLRGVGRTYAPGEPPALAPLDLDLHRGELLAVRGRSGSGKSTLLRLVAGLDRPDVGTVEVLGSALADLDRDGLARLRRAHVGVSTQASALVDDLPLADGIGAGLALRGRPTAVVEELLGAVGLGEPLGRPAGRLSGGERQRGAVVRALAGGTALVVLDEPTSQLDEASAALVAQVLLAAARAGRAVLVATHDPALLACADRVLELEQPGPRAG